jgi:hypothetical protein
MEGARLKAIYAKHLPKPVKMALRTKDKVATGPEELLKWIKSLNPGLHTENWRVLDSKDEPIGRGLILLVDWDTAKIIKRTSYKIFMGLSEGTFKVLSYPKGEIRGWASREKPQAVNTGTEGKGAGDSISTEDREKQPGDDPMVAEILDINTSQAVVKGTPQNPNQPLRGTIRGVNPKDVFNLD